VEQGDLYLLAPFVFTSTTHLVFARLGVYDNFSMVTRLLVAVVESLQKGSF
jgi:hypothetical protein